jgi:uncharacterized membrane protein
MWDRIELKYSARKLLKGTYVNGLIVSFIMLLASGDWLSGKKTSSKINIGNGWHFENIMDGPRMFVENIGIPTFIGLAIALITFIAIVIFIKVIVGYVVEVGGSKYFIKNMEGDSSINYLAYGFKSDRWLNIVKTMFIKSVFVLLWSLLLIIPGIIKWYSYRMVPYILADSPDIDSFEALEISKEMTGGYKGKMFFLDLSFIGWFILGGLFFGIGTVFVMPYYNGTQAEVYKYLKNTRLAMGNVDL